MVVTPWHAASSTRRVVVTPWHATSRLRQVLVTPWHALVQDEAFDVIAWHASGSGEPSCVISWHEVVVRSRRMPRRVASFGLALQAVRAALGLSQEDFGARLGVSRRTLTRWEIHDELPPVGQRKHLATSFPDAPAELRAALVRSLGLGDAFVASLQAMAPSRAAATAQQPAVSLDGALLELCERVDVAPGRLRAALVDFLRRAEAGGLSLQATRAALERVARSR